MRKKLTALLLACLLLVCLVLPVSAADAPALYGTANAADGTVTVTLSLRGGSAVRSGAFTLSYDSSLTLSKTEKGLPLAVANTKEKGKVVCNWVGGAAEADQAVLTLTFTNAATKSYTFKVSGAKVTDKNYETTKIADFPIRIYVACNGKNCPSKSYKDVDQTQWYHNAVDYVLGNDLMKGTGKTTFSPDATLTRGMVVTVLGRAAGVKTSDYTGTSFSDVKAGSWYAPYVQWASKQGLVKGYEDGTFKPLTRPARRWSPCCSAAGRARATPGRRMSPHSMHTRIPQRSRAGRFPPCAGLLRTASSTASATACWSRRARQRAHSLRRSSWSTLRISHERSAG